MQSAAGPARAPALLPADPATGAPASAAPLQSLLLGDGGADLAGWSAGSRQQIRQAASKLEHASPAVENAAFDLAAAGHKQAQAWAEAGRSPIQADGYLDPQFVEEVVQQEPEPAATLAAEQAAAHVPEDERLSIGEAVALGVTTQRTLPASQVRRGFARAVKAAGRDGDLDTALQGELGIDSQAAFGGRAEQAREVAAQMQGAGLGNELGRQLVETVGEGLERNPRLSVQQFREGRLGRMRQWDRATGDPETTDRVVEGLIGLGSMQETTVHEVPRPPAPPSQPAIASTEAEAATQAAPSSAESSPSAAPVPTPAPAAATEPAAEDQYDPAVFEQLREWRVQAARQEGKKTFYVFPDSTLKHIAAARPQTMDELGAVKGVGPKKLAQYGPALLDITRQEPPSAGSQAGRGESESPAVSDAGEQEGEA